MDFGLALQLFATAEIKGCTITLGDLWALYHLKTAGKISEATIDADLQAASHVIAALIALRQDKAHAADVTALLASLS